MKKYLFHFFNFVSLLGTSLNAQVFSTQVQPNPVPLGTKAYWIISANQLLNNVQFNLPTIPNITVKFERKSSQTRIINGKSEQTTSWYFSITPSQEGHFTIPEFSVKTNDATYTIPATRIDVGASGTTASETQTPETDIYLTLDNSIPQKWYVGQCVPSKINLLTPPQMRGQLSSLVQKVGNAFSASHLIEAPQKQAVELQGKTFACLSWPTLLCSLQSGQQTLSFTVDLEVERSRRVTSLFDSNDPLAALRQISNMFDSAEPVTITSRTYKIDILPLPLPQPDNFSQGIGQFNLSSPMPQVKEFIQDEPFTYVVKVSGSGNFDNLQAPQLIYDASQWRVYDPKSNFVPNNDLGYSGEMDYTYTIVPLIKGNTTPPQASLCFFNPVQGQYETITRQPLYEITVKPPLRSPASYSSPIVTNGALESSTTTPFDAIFIDTVVWEKPFSIKTIQIICGIIALILLVAAYFNLRNNYNEAYKARLLATKKFQTLYNEVKQAHKSNDGAAFYAATHQLLMFLLKEKGITDASSLLQGFKDLSIALNDEQQQWLLQSEAFYQESNFGGKTCLCPENLSILKQLLKVLK